MKDPVRRGFRLIDGMILVAATAVGWWLIHWGLVNDRVIRPIRVRFVYYEEIAELLAYPVWLAWTFAALAIGLLPPRPAFRRLARQPGFVACLAVGLCAPFLLGFQLYVDSRYAKGFIRLDLGSYGQMANRAALLVFASWLTLGLNRRWRPEPSAQDRLGRVLGLGWIAFSAANIARLVLSTW